MPLVEEIASDALSEIGSEVGLVTAGRLVARRYRDLAQQYPLRHLRKVAELTLPANLKVGTITLAQGDRIVHGDADARAAWEELGDLLVGRTLHVSSPDWYEIEAVEKAWDADAVEYRTVLRLNRAFILEAVEGVGYGIHARFFELPSDIFRLGDFYLTRQFRRLQVVSDSEAALKFPDRSIKSGGPQVAILHGMNSAGRMRLELYPPAGNRAETLRFLYWRDPGKLQLKDHVPESVAEYLIKATAASLLFHDWRASLKAGNHEVAGHYRNEAHARETRLQEAGMIAAMTDKLTSEESVELILSDFSSVGDFDPVTTAREEILRNWDVPS